MPPVVVALAGNPNAGKTTLFNALTGSRQHVGNYPGVTVEKKEGVCRHQGQSITVVDLPGTYSLTAYSVEEVVAREFLLRDQPDAIVNIVDAANLERNLYLTCQLLEMGVPVILALNMVDVAEDRGIVIDHARLAELLRLPVVPLVARHGRGTKELLDAIIALVAEKRPWQPLRLSYGEDLDGTLLEMEALIQERGFLTDTYPIRWTALKYLENDEPVMDAGRRHDPATAQELEALARRVSDHLRQTLETDAEAIIADHRYGFIKSVVRQAVSRRPRIDRLYASDRIDRVLTHRVVGPLCMVAVLYGLYLFTFTVSEAPVAWLADFFSWLGGTVAALLPPGPLRSLVVSGVIDGVGGVLGFVPLILCMFFGLAFLEDSGYLARVAFMMDRIFRLFGLHGSSVMAYIMSGGIAGGCAVPGVLATRTLRSPKERMATLLTAPFMNCGAKVPVLALFVGIFFPAQQAQILLFLTLLAWLVALVVAKILRLTVLRGAPTPFVMELPPYRLPTVKGLLIHTWERTWQYIRKAGTIILGFSILMWAMMTYPQLPAEQLARLAAQEQAAAAMPAGPERAAAAADAAAARNEAALRYSIAGRIGTGLEKVSQWAGIDWRANVALLGGVAAKEIIISTLGTVYSLGAEVDDHTALDEVLAADPAWTPLRALALVLFIMFYSPCVATLVCIRKETGSWGWVLFSMTCNTLFAFGFAVTVYQAGRLFFAG